jgi:hypothetical protein
MLMVIYLYKLPSPGRVQPSSEEVAPSVVDLERRQSSRSSPLQLRGDENAVMTISSDNMR